MTFARACILVSVQQVARTGETVNVRIYSPPLTRHHSCPAIDEACLAWVHKGNRVDPKDLHFSKVLGIVSGRSRSGSSIIGRMTLLEGALGLPHGQLLRRAWRIQQGPMSSGCVATGRWCCNSCFHSRFQFRQAGFLFRSHTILRHFYRDLYSCLIKMLAAGILLVPAKNIKKQTGATSLPKNRKGSPTGNQKNRS